MSSSLEVNHSSRTGDFQVVNLYVYANVYFGILVVYELNI